jgi:hypothetical protein
MELGQRLYNADYKDAPENLAAISPRYAYNKELNTCLLYVGYLGRDYANYMIIDVLTNTEISSHIRREDVVLGLSFDAFQKEEKRLFGD